MWLNNLHLTVSNLNIDLPTIQYYLTILSLSLLIIVYLFIYFILTTCNFDCSLYFAFHWTRILENLFIISHKSICIYLYGFPNLKK